MARSRVLVIGGGFGGLSVTKALAAAPVDITLVDRRNHHLFQPLLYQVATAGLNPSDIAHPIRSVLRAQDNVRVLLGDAVAINTETQQVELSDGTALPYDFLVIAAGATHSYFGNDAWETHAPGLKTIEDALEIRRRVLMAFEAAERSNDEAEREALLTFAVVGAGATGVETAGAIAEIATHTLTRDFRTIDPATARIVLIEGVDRVLSAYPEGLSASARAQLTELGVEVQTNTMVEAIDAMGLEVKRSDGSTDRIPARTAVWAAGVAGAPIARTLPVERDRAGRVLVEPDLSLAAAPNVFVIGDLASVTVDGAPVPGVAPAANQMGAHAAAMIQADLNREARSAFRYRDKGSLATIGRKAAVAHFGRFRFSGLAAWVLWWGVHIAFLIDFRSRLLVLFSWGWSWLTFKRGARLITQRWRPAAGDVDEPPGRSATASER